MSDTSSMDRASLVDRNLELVSSKDPRKMPQETDQFFNLKLNNNTAAHRNVLYALRNKTFRKLVGDKGGIPATFLGRCPQLDGETITDLLDIVVKDPHHQRHPFYGESGIFIPVPGDYTSSALPIPFFDEFVNMTDPFNVLWSVLTNDQKIASYRIIIRNGIVNSNAIRNYRISPGSLDLTFYLIWIFMSAAEDIAFHGSSTAVIGDFDDTRTKMIRVLVCLILTTCASGKVPACTAYTFLDNVKIPVSKEDFWIPRRLAAILPFTGWDKDLLERETVIYKALH